MTITMIGPHWWRLVSTGAWDDQRLIFHGYTKGEVKGKFNAYIRNHLLEKLR